MTFLSDSAVGRLRDVVDAPDLAGTKYELVGKIAHGGMGTVYVARDRDLDREVALKIVRAPVASREATARMLREARTLARLEHPGIVPVHDVGELPDGRLYYAMKLVRGGRLDEHARAGRPLPELLRIVGRICEAVAFAHAHGVIHRDLKPDNVMVGAFGEVLVMDWGVAKLRGDPASVAAAGSDACAVAAADGPHTDPGTVLGTPGYMAPEQSSGAVHLIDERTDVFALGAILAYLLAQTQSPVPRALAAIVDRARAPAPGARYATVATLAADLEAWLGGLPVSAYRERLHERLARVAARHRTPILLVLAYLLMRALMLVLSA